MTQPQEAVAEKKTLKKRFRIPRRFRWLIITLIVAIPIGIVELFTQQSIIGLINGDRGKKYIAVVITNKSDATFTIPEEFRKGFDQKEMTFKSFHTNQNIEFRKDDDFLSVNQANIIVKKLIEDEDCVLIIGNSTSQLTEVTLNEILGTEETRPGFLLPIATADNIIDKAKDQNYKAILRMMPNNDKQARTIKDFIFQKYKTPKVAILCDEDNTTYSHNLSQKIADYVLLNNGKIVLKKNYGNSNRFINDYEHLKKYGVLPDIVVFVGISSNGSLLKEELSELKIDIPIIFTDGCTVKNLMESSKNSSNYYFVSAVKKPKDEDDAPTYEPVGVDAKMLARLIIDKIDGNITRKNVANFIEKNRNQITLDEDGLAGKYNFDEAGDNVAMYWKVYSYKDGKLIKVFGDDK